MARLLPKSAQTEWFRALPVTLKFFHALATGDLLKLGTVVTTVLECNPRW